MRERRQFEVIESRQMDHLRVFHDVARTLTTSLDLEEILLAIMDKMASFFGPERWSLLMVDEKANDLYYAIAVGEDANSLRDLRIPLGEGIAGWVAQTGNPLVVPDVSIDPHWYAFAQRHPDLHIQSIACVPIRSGNKTLGVIQLLNSKLDLLSEYSISFLRILCDYAAIAIGNARSLRLIQELSITDDATGLYNARRLYAVLAEQVALVSIPFGLLFIDLDHFKRVNDVHGHLAGSKVLREVADVFRHVLAHAGPNYLGFRYGGDEFVVLMQQTSKDQAIHLASTLCRALRNASFLQDEDLNLAIQGSFGLATFPEDAETVPGILRAADLQMYEVKNSTRDNLSVAGRGLVMTEPRVLPATHVADRAPQIMLNPLARITLDEAARNFVTSQADGARAVMAASAPAAAHHGSPARLDAHRSPKLRG